jgi:hypothetical protein
MKVIKTVTEGIIQYPSDAGFFTVETLEAQKLWVEAVEEQAEKMGVKLEHHWLSSRLHFSTTEEDDDDEPYDTADLELHDQILESALQKWIAEDKL